MPTFRDGSAGLDELAVERLLSGTLHPDDAPPSCHGLAALLHAASAPPALHELRGEQAAVAAFTAARRDAHRVRSLSVRGRTSRASRFLTAKVAAATLTTVVAVGGVAMAATVVRTASHNDDAKVVRDVGKAGTDRGPDATGSAAAGLCRAWAAGSGQDNGGMEDSAAFQALIDAAGGEDKIPAFCAAADRSATTGSNAGTAGGEDNSQGPLATEAGRGLCKSWAAGAPNETTGAKRQRMGSPAFEALVEAAGGEANIPAFCATTSTTESQEDSTTPGNSGDHGPPAETDRGSQTDQGRSSSSG